ncbi:hypothetical protein [Legionella rowbothamii]|uniref:hypothetical protein n=1 Tax=Legionella rowbothamii TaxID=96229 RepID=UPI0010559080|nr:hypothetical protein [Legionella rowbothamii]
MANIRKFTDHNLMLFYGNVLQHYKDCTTRHNDVTSIYNELFLAVQFSLESPHGNLHYLDSVEKAKVYKFFNAIFYALPIYKDLSEREQENFKPELPKFNAEIKFVYNNYNHNCHDSFLFDWLLINSIIHDCHGHPGFPHGGFPHGGFPADHGHGGNCFDTDSEVLAALALLIMAAVAAVLASIAVYYMLNQFLEGAERFYYNEGWLKAALVLANSLAFGAGSTVLSLTFAAAPLTSLAIMAGFNPAIVVVTGAVLLSIIGAGIGAFAMNLLYRPLQTDKNAIDPNDPLRFRLTANEEYNLASNGIDPSMVKLAIVALRSEIAKHLNSNNAEVPSFFSRKDKGMAKVNECLQKVRGLRSGTLTCVEVGGLIFDCQLKTQYYLPPQVYVYVPVVEQRFVSAPPQSYLEQEQSHSVLQENRGVFDIQYQSVDGMPLPTAPIMDEHFPPPSYSSTSNGQFGYSQ